MSSKRFGSGFFVALVGALMFAGWMAGAAQAQSTWQQIKQKGELRIGVTPGEPWYFKDPASGGLLFNFDGTVRSGLGDPRQAQLGLRYLF